ncbi:MAG: tetratricopeptide repeat protein [Burkholderiales bacterium]
MELATTSRRLDFRGCEISGATPAALEAYESALAAFQSWRSGTDRHLATALQDAPSFVMAHVLQAYQCLASRDPASVLSARPMLDRASRLRANARERLHLAAIAAALADDYERAKTLLGELLLEEPRDVLALQVAHAFDYLTGDIARLGFRAGSVLPAWSSDLPGYHAVLAMHAFGLGEAGDYERSERFARRALSIDPFDARAHHALAHVFEMTERFDDGVQWMTANVERWGVETVVATHCWWHLALFHLALGRVDEALRLYDERVRPDRSDQVADMIDASALLWRIELMGGDPGARWSELALAWSSRIGDGFCTFSDLHAMLAFVGARDWDLARRLERELAWRQILPTRHGETTRRIGLPASRALLAFGRGDFKDAIGLLASLPESVYRIGGSHAQRDVLHLTLLRSVERLRKPVTRVSATARVPSHAAPRSWQAPYPSARPRATYPPAA